MSTGIKSGFFIIACEMQAIKDEWVGKKADCVKYISEKTGYKTNMIANFLRAKAALEKCARAQILPDSEGVIRPLAKNMINKFLRAKIARDNLVGTAVPVLPESEATLNLQDKNPIRLDQRVHECTKPEWEAWQLE